MQKPYKSIQVFKNPFLEKFTHVHPITPFLFWVPVVFFLLWRSVYVHNVAAIELASLSLIALVAWTFVEYFLHRFAFHYEGESVWAQKLHFLIHGLHHDDPNDPTRLVMPPVASVAIASVLFPLFRLFMGPVWVEPFFACFVVGYLIYDYTHFAVHHFRPVTRFGKMLKHHHMQHHFVDPNSRFGVSSPLWDLVFGTLASSVKGKKSTV